MDIPRDLNEASRPASSVNVPLLCLHPPIFYDTTRAPIDTLPNEVLSLIFRISAHHASNNIHYGVSQCVILLKVCRHWHALIMNDGFLWSFVHTDLWGAWESKTYRRVQNQVKRARNFPLHVSHYSPRTLFWTEDLAAPLMNMKSLHLGVDLQTVRKVMELISEERPPRLEKLSIFCEKPQKGQEEDDGKVYWLPSATVETLPSLRRIVLENAYVTLTSLPHSLTELSLTGPVSLNRHYEIHAFFDVLSELSYLEALNIKLVVILNEFPNVPLPVVKLPRLESLSITSYLDIIHPFLANIQAHPDVRIKSTIHYFVKDSYAVSEFFLAPLRQRFRRPKTLAYASRIQALVVETTATFSSRIQMYGYDHADVSRVTRWRDCEGEGTDTVLNFAFIAYKCAYRLRTCRKIFRTIMTEVRVLEVRAGYKMLKSAVPTVGWWKMALWNLVSLEVVYVSADVQTCRNFCEALRSLVEQRPRNFPRLKRVFLHKYSEQDVRDRWRWWCVRPEESTEGVDPLEVPTSNFEEVIKVARTYREAGYGALEVVMTNNSDFAYWPGLDKTRELEGVVASFSYVEMTQ